MLPLLLFLQNENNNLGQLQAKTSFIFFCLQSIGTRLLPVSSQFVNSHAFVPVKNIARSENTSYGFPQFSNKKCLPRVQKNCPDAQDLATHIQNEKFSVHLGNFFAQGGKNITQTAWEIPLELPRCTRCI